MVKEFLIIDDDFQVLSSLERLFKKEAYKISRLLNKGSYKRYIDTKYN